MEIEIGELTSTVRTVDGQALLTPQVAQALVSVVTQATKDKEAQEQRARAERRVTGGVSQERDEER
jgi:uncharacterized protein YggE